MAKKELKTLLITDKELSMLISSVEHYQEQIANKCKKEADINSRRHDILEGLRTKLFSL
jgi:hypothetical protein